MSSALEVEGRALREYVGPAVPLGDDFEGLVYLHGQLGLDDPKLVLTDGDFGAAYLRDGWATRFLDRMFSRFNVLFVGYSHKDITMEYLAKGLRGHKTRFVLIHAPADPIWPRLELVPVTYTLTDGEEPHSVLPIGISRWAEREAAGLLDNDARVAQIVVAPPPLAPEDDDFLTELLDDPVQVEFILGRIEDPAWITWLATKPAFKALFRKGDSFDSGSSARRLAEWFANRCTADEERSREALLWLHTLGGRLSPTLWVAVALALHQRSGPRPAWLEPWLWALLDEDPGLDRDLLNYALEKTDWEHSADSGLLLLEHLTRPRISVTVGWNDTASYDLAFRGDAYWLDHARVESLAPHVASLAPALIELSGSQIHRAHLLRRMYEGSASAFDIDSFRRSAIEEDQRDRHHEPLDVLLDIARDAIDCLAQPGEALEPWVNSWALAEAPLLRRLAIYAQSVRGDVGSAQRIEWLVEHEFLDDVNLRHEVFSVIRQDIGQVDEALIDSLVNALQGPDADYDEHSKFSALAWAQSHGASSVLLNDVLARYAEIHPDWEVPEEADVTFGLKVGMVQPRPPMTLPAFEELARTAPRDALSFVADFRGKDWSFSDSSWNDAAALVVDLAEKNADLGLVLAQETGEADLDVREALVRGWSAASDLGDGLAQRVLGTLKDWAPSMPSDVASLLNGRAGDTSTDWWAYAEGRDLALECWAALPVDTPPERADDWLMRAINHPAGHLAQFWMRALQDDRRHAGDSWAGIPEPTRSALDAMVKEQTERGALARVLLSSQMRFLDAADHDWTVSRILPRMDWASNEVEAPRCWHGFLTWGFWTASLLDAGLLKMYGDASQHFGDLPPELQRQMALHLGTLILRAEAISDRTDCALNWSATAPEPTRVAVLHAIGRLLRDGPANEPDEAWADLIGPYWEARIGHRPIPLSEDEASALVELLPTFDTALSDAIRLALRSPAVLGPWARLVSDLRLDLVERHADEIAELLTYLLKQSAGPIWVADKLKALFEKLKAHATVEHVHDLREAVLAFGITSARDW